MSELRVALVGLGPIGIEIGRALIARRDVRIAAAADRAPELAGRPLAELLPGAPEGLRIDSDFETALGRDIEAVALATGSRFADVVPALEAAVRMRVHVVSTCEEMAAPASDTITWARLDERAKHAGLTLLGTGVNPGFVMDRLVLQLAGACVSVEEVAVERVVDAAKRRGPLRKKVGEGLTVAEFEAGVRERRIGHVGLCESATLIARGLDWKLENYEESIEPVVGPDGRCRGLRQEGRAIASGRPRIALRLEMYVGAEDPHDRIRLQSDPPIDARIGGGTQGDRGTIGAVINGLRRLRSAPRGLVTVADVFC